MAQQTYLETFVKFRYRMVHDRKNENKAQALIQLEVYNPATRRKMYVSTGLRASRDEWDSRNGLLKGREGTEKANGYLISLRHSCEAIELDYILRGVRPTFEMLRADIRNKKKLAAEGTSTASCPST